MTIKRQILQHLSEKVATISIYDHRFVKTNTLLKELITSKPIFDMTAEFSVSSEDPPRMEVAAISINTFFFPTGSVKFSN